MSRSVIVVGAGVFGIPTALELRRRGWNVTMLGPGPIPHPLAASTDISKVIRMEYGPDVSYMRLAETARAGWLAWIGLVDAAGREVFADEVVVAAGVWTAMLVGLPQQCIRPSGHPVFHLRPANPARFQSGLFPVFTADITRTGCYWFPINGDGVVKVATHGLGIKLGADDARDVQVTDHDRMRGFLAEMLPALADAPVVHTRPLYVCGHARRRLLDCARSSPRRTHGGEQWERPRVQIRSRFGRNRR